MTINNKNRTIASVTIPMAMAIISAWSCLLEKLFFPPSPDINVMVDDVVLRPFFDVMFGEIDVVAFVSCVGILLLAFVVVFEYGAVKGLVCNGLRLLLALNLTVDVVDFSSLCIVVFVSVLAGGVVDLMLSVVVVFV